MKWRQVSPSSVSIFCSSDLVPSAAGTSAWVSPRVKIVEPWARGRDALSIVIGRTSLTFRPSTRVPLSTISRRTCPAPVASRAARAGPRLGGRRGGARVGSRARRGGAGSGRAERWSGLVFLRRVRPELGRHESDSDRGEGTVERDAREGERRGGAVHRQDVGVVLRVGGDREADDLDLVAEAVGEEWADGPVDQPAREGFLFRRCAFPPKIAPWDPAARVHALAGLDRH